MWLRVCAGALTLCRGAGCDGGGAAPEAAGAGTLPQGAEGRPACRIPHPPGHVCRSLRGGGAHACMRACMDECNHHSHACVLAHGRMPPSSSLTIRSEVRTSWAKSGRMSLCLGLSGAPAQQRLCSHIHARPARHRGRPHGCTLMHAPRGAATVPAARSQRAGSSTAHACCACAWRR
jgi:hypothetical protein